MQGLAAELAGIDLGDRRLNRRAQRLVETLGAKPTLSIPGACSGWDETRAAYRLFDQDAVTAEAVLAPHIACTEARLRAHPRVLCIQDTTELDYTKKKNVIGGLGVLNLESRWGLYLHPTLVVTPERVPLGVLDAHRFTREPGSLGQPKDRRRPLEDKESARWVDGFARVNALAERFPETRPVYIADREGDIYDVFVEAPCPQTGADWLIRGQHHERLLKDGRTLRQALDAAPVLTEITFERPAASARPARPVTQQLKAVRVTLKAPARPDRTLPEVSVTALLAEEINPPPGEVPLQWLLLTNLPVEDAEQALEKLAWYLCRWQVERAFRNLKTVQLEIRPVYHKHDERIRSHVFLCMLAYYLQWHMEQRLAPLFSSDGKGQDRRWTLRGVIDCLVQITRNRVAVNGAEFDQNSTPTPEQEQILELLQVTM